MSGNSEDGKTGIFGQDLPGTGGDVLPTDMDNDTEGHSKAVWNPKAVPDEEPADDQDTEGHLGPHGANVHGPGAIPEPKPDEPTGTSDEQDVEGHLSLGLGKGHKAVPDDDVEGHLFHTGPTTEGEFSRRGPGENPHGDR